MKRILILLMIPGCLSAQEAKSHSENDSLAVRADAATDSLYRTLPEVMVTGERPIVKAEPGRLLYDLPRLVGDLPVDNAYDAVKELPGVSEMDGGLQLAGQPVTVILDGKVTTLSAVQLRSLLQSLPVNRIERAEVMYNAPARYQVRGALINLVLRHEPGEKPLWQGEFLGKYVQLHDEAFTERVSLIHDRKRFSFDFLYSHRHGHSYRMTRKEADHALTDGTVIPVANEEAGHGRSHEHSFRLGADCRLAEKHLLSLVYNGKYDTNHMSESVRGTQQSSVRSDMTGWLHNGRLDYNAPFGLSAAAEVTWYRSPSEQRLGSLMQDIRLDFLSRACQRINRWKFSLAQNHELKKGWGVNYGAVYETGVDNSYQYYDALPEKPDASSALPADMRSRRREETLNLYAGFSKSFSELFSFDVSVAAERYKTPVWSRWDVYPVANLGYRSPSGHFLQFSLSSDKRYPDYWVVQDAVSYLGGSYSEIHGNPLLRPSRNYRLQLVWMLKNKYVFVAWFNHTKEYATQTLSQMPDRLVEVYKYFNFDYQRQSGVQVVLPFRIGSFWNVRPTLVGVYLREKDDDFRGRPFDRSVCYGMAMWNNTFTLSTRHDLKLTLNGMVRSKAIQATYDLPASGYVNLGLRYAFAGGKAVLNFSCNDLFETGQISPRIRHGNWVMRTSCFREWSVSFTWRFGGYREKQRKEVDTSRFKL